MKTFFTNIQKMSRMGRRSRCGRSTSGFTIVETLVAISIVLLGVTTVFTSAQVGISSTSGVRNRVTAMFLAQEGLEAVKNLKDSNLHAIIENPSADWLEGMTVRDNKEGPCPTSAASCGFDAGEVVGSQAFFSCEDGDCTIYTDINNDLLRQSGVQVGGPSSGFIREIFIEETVPDKQVRVRVLVSRPGSNFSPFEVTTYMYNWF